MPAARKIARNQRLDKKKGPSKSFSPPLVGLKDEITAVTSVALGTSLPDTFGSKAAAAKEKTADNAIGNVTGSNSVNVFMGLGIPWMIASIYWAIVVSFT